MKNHMLKILRLEQTAVQRDGRGRITSLLETWRWRCTCGVQDKASSEEQAVDGFQRHSLRTQYGVGR